MKRKLNELKEKKIEKIE